MASLAAVGETAPSNALPVPPVPLESIEIEAESAEGTFYQALWRSADLEIERADRPRWNQSDFAAATPGIVSMRSYEANASSFSMMNGAQMIAQRNAIASRIFDQRIMTVSNHGYAMLRRKNKVLGKADAAMTALGNGGVDLSATPKAAATPAGAANGTAPVAALATAPVIPTEFRYGYILLNDTGFVTLRQRNSYDVTLRRARLLTGSFGSAPTFLTLTKYFQSALWASTFTYTVHAPSAELRVARSFTPMFDVSAAVGHDFVQDSSRLYFTLAYRW